MTGLLAGFRACCTAPTFATFMALCAGLLAQPGPSTVTGMLSGARLGGIWHHARAHRFFTHARWRPDQPGLLLADLIISRLLGPDEPILLAVDDTLFHRASRRLPLAAWHHDPTARPTAPAALVERYAARWAIEVTFLESKHLVGVGQARNRRRHAVERTVPFGLVCHSLLVCWYTLNGHGAGDVATRRALAPWYRHKHTPSTLDMLVAFRRAMLAEYHRTRPAQPTGTKLTDALLTWDVTAA